MITKTKRSLLLTVLTLCICLVTICFIGCAGLNDPDSGETSDIVHEYGEGVVTKEATCGADGTKQFTCTVCGEIKEEKIPATGAHTYDTGKVSKEPTCSSEGVKTFTCTACGGTKEEAIGVVDHAFDSGVITVEPTCYDDGIKLYTCKFCGETSEEVLAKLDVAFTITIEGIGEVYVPESGKYKLTTPEKAGYSFVKWIDADGEDFASEGRISADITIKPVFVLLETSTLAELEARAAMGADKILIVNDIVIDRTIYITDQVTIYSESEVKLIRHADFAGDMFVVGHDKDGVDRTLDSGIAKLTLGSPDGSSDITVDGNAANMNVDVVGSAIFVVNGARFDMYDGAEISDHTKTGNARSLLYPDHVGETSTAGGAGVLVVSGSFYMWGGLMDNNNVNVTNVGGAENTAEDYFISSYGGSVHNNGTFTMYGGTISNSSANRGGAIFSRRIVKIYGGTIEGNYAENKGGAICMSESAQTETYIGEEDAAADTLVFRNNTAKTQGGAILAYHYSPIVVYGGTTFEGNTAQTSVGGAISTSGTLTVSNTVFRSNNAYESGGAVYQYYSGESAAHPITFNGCTFESNEAGRGGVIMISAADDLSTASALRVSDCTFTGNKSKIRQQTSVDPETGDPITVDKYGNGAVIYITKKTTLSLTDSEFINNSSDTMGGALYLTTDTKTTVEDCTFTGNTATNGAVIYMTDGAKVTVTDTTFSENTAKAQGGAIYMINAQAELVGCTFTGNKATTGNADTDKANENNNGGAIYVYNSSATINNCDFTSNYAGYRGGAIYATQIPADAPITTKSCVFDANEAASHGGAIYLTGTGAYVDGSESTDNVGSTFTDNESGANGGAIASYGSIKLYDSVFGGKTEVSGSPVYSGNVALNGGALSVWSTAVLDDVDFIGNTANTVTDVSDSGNGGAVYVANGASLTENSSYYEANTANKGGAIYMLKGSESKPAALVSTNSEFKSNSSVQYGGAICAYNYASLTLNNITVTDNTSGAGGAIWTYTESVTKITGIVAKGNDAKSGGAIYTRGHLYIYSGEGVVNTFGGTNDGEGNKGETGGAIYVNGSDNIVSIFDLTGATFVNNTATADGGAISVSGADAKITDCTFTGNSAASYGGAVHVTNQSSAVITNCTFTSNSAGNNGGSLYVTKSNSENVTNTLDCIFNSNSATGNGGAVYVTGTGIYTDGSATVDAKGSVFEQNTAANGGAVYVYGTATLNDSRLKNNSANTGGAVYVYGTVTLNENEFVGNKANKVTDVDYSGYGGAIYTCGTLANNGSTFTDNVAQTFGGAIYVADGKHFADSGSSYSGNTANNGGAVYVAKQATAEFENSQFTNNIASVQGGAVYLYHNSSAELVGCTFTGNKATTGNADTDATNANNNGGALYITTASASFDNCTFTSNYAGYRGGAIYVTQTPADAPITTKSCVFDANEAANHGGAIYLTGTGAYVDGSESTDNVGSTFTDNKSGASGGAIGSYGTVTLNDTAFTGNTATTEGGAVEIFSGTANINDCTFTSNSAVKAGGAIHVSGGTLNVTGGNMTSNSISENVDYKNLGGAIGVTKGTVSINGVTFKSNTATQSGGAVAFYGSAVVATVENCVFESNTSRNGAALYAGGASNVTVINITAKGNTATELGAVIYITTANSVLTLNSATVYDNNTAMDISCGFVHVANASATLNIYKSEVTMLDSDTNAEITVTDWTDLIKNPKNGTVNELTVPEN